MRRFATLVFALAAAASPLAAQSAHPDFSGKWVLDPKSVEGPVAPTSATMVIVQNAKILKMDQSISSSMGDQKASLSFNLDGSASKNSVSAQGMTVELNSTAAWEGAALVVKTTADIQGQALTQTERWTVDPDGKTLRVQRDASAAGQSMTMKMVFTRM
jgi:hypothetical protein